MSLYIEEQIAGLKTYFIKGDENAPTILMLHGYGANGKDLIGLSSEIKTNKKYNWIFPEGFISLEDSIISGKAWFNIDWLLLNTLLKTGKIEDYSILEPPGLEEAKGKILELIQILKLNYNQLIIGGFSQGAMLSTEIAISSNQTFKSLLILSGTLICKERWKKQASQNKNFPFFQSHGINDMVLQYEKAKQLYDTLNNETFKGSFHEFKGGHEIPNSITQKIAEFLNNLEK